MECFKRGGEKRLAEIRNSRHSLICSNRKIGLEGRLLARKTGTVSRSRSPPSDATIERAGRPHTGVLRLIGERFRVRSVGALGPVAPHLAGDYISHRPSAFSRFGNRLEDMHFLYTTLANSPLPRKNLSSPLVRPRIEDSIFPPRADDEEADAGDER